MWLKEHRYIVPSGGVVSWRVNALLKGRPLRTWQMAAAWGSSQSPQQIGNLGIYVSLSLKLHYSNKCHVLGAKQNNSLGRNWLWGHQAALWAATV